MSSNLSEHYMGSIMSSYAPGENGGIVAEVLVYFEITEPAVSAVHVLMAMQEAVNE